MLNSISLWGNANQNHNEFHQNGCKFERLTIGKNVKTLKPSCIAGRNVCSGSLFGSFLKKLNIERKQDGGIG